MRINGIDHVNLLTDDLDASAAFYELVLGLARSDIPIDLGGLRGVWLRDGDGQAVIHLIDRLSMPESYAGHNPGASTNGFHHVAFSCTGFDDCCARLEELGIDYRPRHFAGMTLRQIVVQGPDAVNIELNFVAA
ncbi:VOC family protein [Novosphingobium colocasiae]|uniref:VOC family protein n=1 Tax=Novosphingobium colocasiae TaxID=1256513 RepID=UPI0035B0E659